MNLVFDIGMFNGDDSAYYLESGCRVVAVEANPSLVQRANKRFAKEINAGLMTVVNAALNSNGESMDLHVSADDVGSSSVVAELVAAIQPIGTYTVPGVRLCDLISKFGVPYYLKVDIEGADKFAILPLDNKTMPKFVSFEIGKDFEELLTHLETLGFRNFKIINQTSFRHIDRENLLSDRVIRRIIRLLGYSNPRSVRRRGRFFSGGSSGPAPWESDGSWMQAQALLSRFEKLNPEVKEASWYDLQAAAN